MKLHIRRRYAVGISLALAAVIATSGAVFAYWTSTGSGTAQANADAGTANVSIFMTSTVNAMYPGDSPQTISGDFTNPGPNAVHAVHVVVAIASVNDASDAVISDPAVCSSNDFTLSPDATIVGSNIPVSVAPAHSGSWTGATIQFNERGVNQDGCKNVHVHLSFSLSQS